MEFLSVEPGSRESEGGAVSNVIEFPRVSVRPVPVRLPEDVVARRLLELLHALNPRARAQVLRYAEICLEETDD